ncbi:hypothetical protein SLS64_009249 [Diaporthe eres]|uniref:Heterokaryon incompatibility domain-containing protein n=1 Tax=Diaporthe eres TaxID=83184 RepID=A0ABR1NQW1_DIAER
MDIPQLTPGEGETTAPVEASVPLPIYYELNRPKQEIRVLEIESVDPIIVIKIHVVSLNDKPSFNALSYVWGDKANQETITVNGTQVSVTRNLHEALQDVHRHWQDSASPISTRRLWADAISINQDDNEERGHQVPLMSRIYSEADHVFAWLGRGPGQLFGKMFDEAFNLLEMISQELSSQGTPVINAQDSHDESHFQWMSKYPEVFDRDVKLRISKGEVWTPPANVWDNVMDLMSQSYWTRVWIFQEMFLSQPGITFISGTSSLPYESMVKVSLWLDEMLTRTVKPQFMSADIWEYLQNIRGEAVRLFCEINALCIEHKQIEQLANKLREGDITIRDRASALRCLQVEHHAILMTTLMTNAFKATDRKDYVYGILGISKLEITPDYQNYDTRPSSELLLLWANCDDNYLFLDDRQTWGLMDLWFLPFSLAEVAPPKSITTEGGVVRWMPFFYQVQYNSIRASFQLSGRQNQLPAFGGIFAQSLTRWCLNAQHFICSGVMIDRVAKFGPSTKVTKTENEDTSSKYVSKEVVKWVANRLIEHTYYPTGQHYSIPMQRALLNDEDPLALAENQGSDVTKLFVWLYFCNLMLPSCLFESLYTHFHGPDLFRSIRKDERSMDCSVDYIESQGSSYRIERDTVKQLEHVMRMQIHLDVAGHKRIGVTEKAYIGRFHRQSDEHDEIWLLNGYDRPVILRKVDEHYIFVGSAYIVEPLGGRSQEEIDILKSQVTRIEIF